MRRLLVTIVLMMALVAAVSGGGVWWVVQQWDTPLQPDAKSDTVVNIPSGATLRSTSHRLQRAGVVADAQPLEWLGRWQGSAAQIRPGEYLLGPAMTPREVLAKIRRGDVIQHPVTLPEGLTVDAIVTRLSAAGFGSVDAYHRVLSDPNLMTTWQVETKGVKIPYEGYLFPDTYHFTKGTQPEQVIAALLARMDAAFSPRRKARMKALGWRRHQVLTMASLIEKETAQPAERARISAVFHNRLRKRMRLQTDPTVIYATPHFDGNIRTRDLHRDDPYNTYRHHGLPPGPIASAGEAAIEAALFPTHESSLYFVSRGDGTHVFSNTARDHQRAVKRYQRGHR